MKFAYNLWFLLTVLTICSSMGFSQIRSSATSTITFAVNRPSQAAATLIESLEGAPISSPSADNGCMNNSHPIIMTATNSQRTTAVIIGYLHPQMRDSRRTAMKQREEILPPSLRFSPAHLDDNRHNRKGNLSLITITD